MWPAEPAEPGAPQVAFALAPIAIAELPALALPTVQSTCRNANNRPPSAKCGSTSARGNRDRHTGSPRPPARFLPPPAGGRWAISRARCAKALPPSQELLPAGWPPTGRARDRCRRGRKPGPGVQARWGPAIRAAQRRTTAGNRSRFPPVQSCAEVPNLEELPPCRTCPFQARFDKPLRDAITVFRLPEPLLIGVRHPSTRVSSVLRLGSNSQSISPLRLVALTDLTVTSIGFL
jgi:hypothetical protein